MISHELVLHTGKDVRKHFIVMYEQPLWRWLIAKAYHHWDMQTGRFTIIDRVQAQVHKLRCNDDCGFWTDRDGNTDPGCCFMPFTVKQDLRCYELSRRDRDDLFEIEITEEQAQDLRTG